MAIIEAISSKADIKTIIKYVTQDKKTNANLITGKDCLAESCLEEMLYTKNFYKKNSGRQYIHIIQSFDPKDDLSAEEIHKAGIKLAERFNSFQVLVATHIDKEHLHNHLIINSVSFENGYKIQMSKKDLQDLKRYSDEICLQIGASVIPKKENTNYIKRNEYRVAERGESWKFKLMNAIDLCIAESNNKEEFIKIMNKLGYQVNWTDTRKYITYTTPEGYKCRDNKLFDEKYLKGEMENRFRRINKREYENERGNEELNGEKIERTILQSKTRDELCRERTESNNIQSKIENGISNFLGGIIAISDMVSNSKVNYKQRNIRGYRSLSKQAKKEYAKKKANASSFGWDNEEEM